MEIKIKMATPSDLEIYSQHLVTQVNQNGSEGIIYAPIEPGTFIFEESDKERTLKKWSKKIQESGWEVCFLAKDRNRVVGHLCLKSHDFKPMDHRVLLQMGIENGYKRSGIGSLLVSEAIQWAQSIPTLFWLDLFVFEKNEPAKALYKKFGFIQVGQVIDRFRVQDQSIDDLQFSLKLK